MSYARPHRCNSAPLLIAAILVIAWLPSYAQADAPQDNTLAIPGGLSSVARIINLDNAPLHPSSAVERIFTAILRSEPPSGGAGGINPLRRDLSSYLKQHNQFIKYLHDQNLVPPDADWNHSQYIQFPLSGTKEKVDRTRRVLSFFGIQSRLAPAETGNSMVLEIPSGVSPSKHQLLFDSLGFHSPDSDTTSIRIHVPAERIPMLLDQLRWRKILSGKTSGSMFEKFVRDPDAMRLYLAFAGCSRTIREFLADSIESSQLLKNSSALLLFGSDLKLKDGALEFPGSREAWASLPHTPTESPGALLAGGVPLVLYSSMAVAPAEVQAYMTDSGERLQSYFEILKPYSSDRFSVSTSIAMAQDLSRVLRMAKVDSGELVLALDTRISQPLLNMLISGRDRASDSGRIRLTPRNLAKLLPRPGFSPYAETSKAGILEFYQFLEKTQPETLSAESIKSLLRSPSESPIFMDIVGDLSPEPQLLSDYLEYCYKLAAKGMDSWNLDRTRTSQSIFFLISALSKEGALSPQEADSLLRSALKAFVSDDQSAFVFKTSEFLSAQLIPALSHCPGDSILSALSGNQPPRQFQYGNKQLVLDLSARKYERMQQTMRSQSHTPLSTLLDICALLRNIEAAHDPSNAEANIKLLLTLIPEIRTAEWTPGGSKSKFDKAVQTQAEMMMRSLRSAEIWNDPKIAYRGKARDIASQIHSELGVTLLAYCYAYIAAPEIYILKYDPNFVRKHRFYPADTWAKPYWSRAHFVQDEETGGLMEGSLAGLGFEMTRLQVAQTNHESGIASNVDLAPAIIFGARQVRTAMRTDRGQEYVALATDLGRRLVSLRIDNRLGQWVSAALGPLISRQRLEEVERMRGQNADLSAPEILSSSELFLLGNAFFVSKEWLPERCPDPTLCSTIDRIRPIVPKPGSEEYNLFQAEVSQYGTLMRSRIGLSKLSFNMIDSYERLEKHLDPQNLYERICDLKIRIAELNNALGLPASLGEVEADLAVTGILPPASQGAGNWKHAIYRINQITEKSVSGWINQLILNGSLSEQLPGPEGPKS